MKKHLKTFGFVLCSLSLSLSGNALATKPEELQDYAEEQTDLFERHNEESKDCHLFFLKNNLSLQAASMDAGDPINTFHLFVTGMDGKIIKNAQVVTNIIDENGNQQLSRALPFKGGYLLAIDHLVFGQYLVETEILIKGQLLTEMFRFNKA